MRRLGAVWVIAAFVISSNAVFLPEARADLKSRQETVEGKQQLEEIQKNEAEFKAKAKANKEKAAAEAKAKAAKDKKSGKSKSSSINEPTVIQATGIDKVEIKSPKFDFGHSKKKKKSRK